MILIEIMHNFNPFLFCFSALHNAAEAGDIDVLHQIIADDAGSNILVGGDVFY